MRTRASFGAAFAFLLCLGGAQDAQASKCWAVDQTGTTTVSSVAIEFHTIGSVPDTCGALQACTTPDTTCVTGLIPVGPSVSAGALASSIVAEINSVCAAPSKLLDLAGQVGFQVNGPILNGCSVLTGQPGDIPAGMCLPMESCEITNLSDGNVGNESGAQTDGYRLTPIPCPPETPALSPIGLGALLLLLGALGAVALKRWRHSGT